MDVANRGRKLDLARADKPYYAAPRHPQLVMISGLAYLAIAGEGASDSSAFTQAVAALYKPANGVKAQHKAAGRDFAGVRGCGQRGCSLGHEDDSASARPVHRCASHDNHRHRRTCLTNALFLAMPRSRMVKPVSASSPSIG